MKTAARSVVNAATTDIPADMLTLGMYVADLDRPWIETPFLFQGFEITSAEEIATLRSLCRRVKVLDEDGSIARRKQAQPAGRPAPTASASASAVESAIFRTPGRRMTDTKHVVQEEVPAAKAAHSALVSALASTMDDLRAGHALDVARIQSASQPLIESIARNPDALAWLSMIREKDNGIYNQSITAAVLILTLGRHLGLPRAALDSLVLGGLLFDIGKTRIPDDILLKPDRLTDAEFHQYKQHVDHGVAILGQTGGINDVVLSMLRTHHERHDGSGYPLGLKGDDIPAFGKIAGIVDAYQTMLSSNAAGKKLSPHRVLAYLSKHRDLEFESALVEEFIQAIGIYPTGTLVELSDGRVGVVLEQNRLRRLLPKVLLLLDAGHHPLPGGQTLDLVIESSRDSQLHIVDCLEPGSYGIDPDDNFL